MIAHARPVDKIAGASRNIFKKLSNHEVATRCLDTLLMLTKTATELQQKENIGMVSHADVGIAKAQITSGLLDILNNFLKALEGVDGSPQDQESQNQYLDTDADTDTNKYETATIILQLQQENEHLQRQYVIMSQRTSTQATEIGNMHRKIQQLIVENDALRLENARLKLGVKTENPHTKVEVKSEQQGSSKTYFYHFLKHGFDPEETKKCIEALSEYLQTTGQNQGYNDVIILFGKFNTLLREHSETMITAEHYNMGKARIMNSLKYYIEEYVK